MGHPQSDPRSRQIWLKYAPNLDLCVPSWIVLSKIYFAAKYISLSAPSRIFVLQSTPSTHRDFHEPRLYRLSQRALLTLLD